MAELIKAFAGKEMKHNSFAGWLVRLSSCTLLIVTLYLCSENKRPDVGHLSFVPDPKCDSSPQPDQ